MSNYSSESTEGRRFAYEWNKPRQAIGYYAAAEPERGFSYLTPTGERKPLSFDDLQDVVSDREKPDLHKYLRHRLARLPHFIRHYYATQLDRLDAGDQACADAWLVNTFERHVLPRIDKVNDSYMPGHILPSPMLEIREQFWRMLWTGKKGIKRLAHNLADLLTGEFMREQEYQLERTQNLEFSVISGYGRIGFLASHLKTGIPGWQAYCKEELEAEDALRAVSRLESPKWWTNRLRRICDRWREHLLISAGYVHKKAAPYCSNPCFKEWLAQKKANREFLKRMELEDQETGERVSLIDKVTRSVANPAIKRAELMARMRGFEDMANADNLVGEFYTLTAPSKYHATLADGRRNDKYNGASPRDTQRYLCQVWAKTRAKWKRKGIRVFGFRVAEPHHDATPHWHLLLFMRPECVELARAIFWGYALAEDGDEAGAEENRFKVKPIDEAFGSATGYIAKYISKNIDAHGVGDERDDETGELLKDISKRVCAWASRWSIRQFQQIGGAPVTVYRELRRIKTNKIEVIGADGKPVVIDREYSLPISAALVDAQQAADDRDWTAYTIAQGGPLVPRDCLRVRLIYEKTENGNDYGDDVERVHGVYCPYVGMDSSLLTRTTKYKIVPKVGTDLAVDLQGGSAAPRSSVNNCTRSHGGGIDGEDRAIDFDALTRQEKRDLGRRLSEQAAKEVAQKRERQLAVARSRAQLSSQAAKLREFAYSIGFDLGIGEISALLSGQKVSLGGQFYKAYGDNTLRRVEGKLPVSLETWVNTWLTRIGVRFRYRTK
ncbi:replication endonuclease [Klebsiella michiganensis]|uniref:replication endonuclease n=1 Tax=Klebsiella michiganensis TaxID=1134687 RepID=UPI002931F219|nr:replication endonuclease [Klebsiella michiganensis]